MVAKRGQPKKTKAKADSEDSDSEDANADADEDEADTCGNITKGKLRPKGSKNMK